jgi:hypothetical protein
LSRQQTPGTQVSHYLPFWTMLLPWPATLDVDSPQQKHWSMVENTVLRRTKRYPENRIFSEFTIRHCGHHFRI